MEEFFSEHGRLSSIINGYQPRDGQLQMSLAVQKILETPDLLEEEAPRILVVEAETGIGKTLAYLLPAILSGKRIVISTATRNLQDQILQKEIPLIEEMFEAKVGAVCVKGRQNYLCLYKWYQYRSTAQLSLIEKTEETEIDHWINSTETGDRAELGWLGDNAPLWHKISSHSDQCLGNECPEQGNCFVTRLRKRAGNAKILIVNHHLFFSDLSLRKGGYGEILPRYEAVVFDEAHHLENTASTFFGKSFSHYQLLDLLADTERLVEADLPADRHKNIKSRIFGLRKRLDTFINFIPKKRGRYPLEDLLTEVGEEQWREEIDLLATGIADLATLIDENKAYGEGWHTLYRRATELGDTLLSVGLAANNERTSNYIHWYDRKEKSLVISATPVSVAHELSEYLYSTVQCTILTSATLSISEKFDYLSERLGLPTETTFLRFASPFDYATRTLCYVPEQSFPETSQPNYTEESCQRVLDILKLSRGRALVLFTSLQAMHTMADWLEDKIEYPLFVQGTQSRQLLLQKFKEQTDSVLLAVASFWEGIDVTGESLSCVIIDKLPFEVPSDPVIKARMEKISEEGGNPFMDFQVPRSVLTLRQGVGRLMRSATDSGVIVILDVRLFTKFYGKRFLKSLPSSPLTRSLSDVEKFFLSSPSF